MTAQLKLAHQFHAHLLVLPVLWVNGSTMEIVPTVEQIAKFVQAPVSAQLVMMDFMLMVQELV